MLVFKLMIFAGIIGHGINLYCDRILSIFPNGTLKLANIQKLREGGFAALLMEGVSPNIPLRSGVLGIFSIVLEFLGYVGMAACVYQRAPVFGVILFFCTSYSCIVSSAYHIKCALAEYVFIKLGRDEKGKEMMLDLMNCGAALRSCYVGLIGYIVTLMAAIVTGAIGFPIWAVLFTTLPIFVLLFPFQIIGTVHISAMVSMLAWILLL